MEKQQLVNEITELLYNYTKKENIMASKVILEDYATILVDNGYGRENQLCEINMQREKQVLKTTNEIVDLIEQTIKENKGICVAKLIPDIAIALSKNDYCKKSDTITAYRELVRQDLMKKGLYLTATKNALDFAEKTMLEEK